MKKWLTLFFVLPWLVCGLRAETEEEAEGMALAKELRSSKPETNSVITATLNIRAGKVRKKIPLVARVQVDGDKWITEYETQPGAVIQEKLSVRHSVDGPNEYYYTRDAAKFSAPEKVGPGGVFAPFAESDFALGELGMEFLHWPAQRRLKGEMRLGRPCYVLESMQAKGAEPARVRCYIDKESKGILSAEVFNADKTRIKEFSLSGSSFKKVNGQWQLESMKMINSRTDSQTILKLDMEE